MWSVLPLLLLAAPAGSAPEIVVLPLSASDALGPQSLEAWKVIAEELAKAKKKLKAQTALQKKQHDFLIGPVREQARDCGEKLSCLAEIGTALGANILVFGKLDENGIGLKAIDVASASAIAEGGSAATLAKQAVKKQAVAATKSLVQALAAHQKKSKNVGKTGPTGPVAEVPAPPPPAEPTGTAPILALGKLVIGKDQLAGVTKVNVDGEVVLFGGDGTISWSGAPGIHRVQAERADGNSVSKELVLEPGQTKFVSLEFPIVAPPAAVAVNDDDAVTSKWWFWTSLGVAVAAGSATAILLLGGEKGGPQLPDSTGTIRGTY